MELVPWLIHARGVGQCLFARVIFQKLGRPGLTVGNRSSDSLNGETEFVSDRFRRHGFLACIPAVMHACSNALSFDNQLLVRRLGIGSEMDICVGLRTLRLNSN